MKNSQFWVIFDDFWDLWSPERTLYPTPDALWMFTLSLGHSIMYVPMKNLIQCMGDMALMPKICEKRQFLCDFWWFLWDIWSPDMTPYATPDAIWMIILSLGHSIVYVTIRNLILCKGYMAVMSKICLKWLILGDVCRFLGSFESIYHSISYSLVSKMFCRSFYQSIWEKLMRNDMPQPVFIPRIPKSTLFVNFSLHFHVRKL